MNAREIIELAIAAALIVWGVMLYRKRSADGSRYGSQTAVILFAIAALLLIHGLGLMEYRPSRAELAR